MSRLTFAQAEIKQPVEFSSSFGNKLGMFSGNIFTGEMPDIAISRPGHDFGKIAVNRSDAFHSAAIAQQDDEPELDELEDKAEQELKLKKIFRRRKSSITNSEEEGKSITPTKSVKERKYTVNQKKKDAEGEQTASPPKLTIGKPDDSFEQEADQVADIIAEESTSTADYSLPKSQITPQVQRQCEECKIEAPQGEEEAEEEEEEEVEPTKIDRKKEGNSDNNSTNATLRNLESKLKASKGGGQPLPDATRQMMENRFGVNFGKVRIHAGDEAAGMNRSIRAKAFTHGNDIYYNQGKYTPHTQEGQWLLAHELAHVVQQSGASIKNPNIRRVEEDKVKMGNWAHKRIQEAFLKRDKKLITEASIPGGNRFEMRYNAVGFADLYKAENNTISGISAQLSSQTGYLEEKYKVYNYVNMRSNWLNKATPQPSKSNIGPKIDRKKKKWDFTPNFPANFQIGEIKPLFLTDFPGSLYMQGRGLAQTGNYREGFKSFVEKVHTDNPKYQSQLPATITGRPLVLNEATHIPDAINYKKFDTEYAKAGADAIQKVDKRQRQRLWVYNKYKNKDGILVYFLLPHPYTSKDFPVKLEDQLRRLDPLFDRLTKKRSPMPNVLTKREDQPSEASPVQTLHRTPKPGIQAKGEDWGKLAEAWQTDRKNWIAGKGTGGDKPKEFLKEQAKGVKKKAKIDDKLNLTPSSPQIREQIKNVKKIRFWSSLRGRILGALRFRFGSVFDKVEDLFQKIKDKFKRHHEASELLNNKNGLFDGWKKIATKLIIKFSVEIFKQTIIEAFKGFINCANGIIEAILNKFSNVVDESKAEVAQKIEPVCCDVMAFKNKVEEEYQKHDATITNFTQKIETLRQWTDILDDVVTAVRVGVQIVSCGLPPGLGCLWGLVAQLGISASLNLLTRTDYFEEEIAKPAARKLMDTIVGDSLHNLLIDLLEAFPPLKPFVQEASACRKRTSVISGSRTIGGNTGKLDPKDPKNIKAREEWEKEYESEILKDLQAVFEKGKGKKVTKEDLQKLVEAIQKSGKSAEEMKQMLEQARNPESRKIDVGKAEINLEMDEVPEAKPKERTIDYEKAVRTNVALQKLNGWDPEQILKMPGIKVDSNEFADAVYDLQKALGIKKDGMLGEETIIAFYDSNKMKKDATYEKAVKVKEQKTQEKEKAKADAAKQASTPSTESQDITAVRVSKPPTGSRVVTVTDLPIEPGACGIPFGVVTPALSESKIAYSVGENISVDIAFWIDNKWVWLTNIQAYFNYTSSLNRKLILDFSVPEDYYFQSPENTDKTYLLSRGDKGIVVFSKTQLYR